MNIFKKCLSILYGFILSPHKTLIPVILHGYQFIHHTFSSPFKILEKGFLRIKIAV